jgi:heme-degrading monooxygenase HmoA
MKISRIIMISFLIEFFVGACRIGTPWEEIKSKDANLEKEVIVGLTYIEVGNDSEKNKIFWKHTFDLKNKLKKYSGFIGVSIRKEIFGNKGWTMSVWEDEESLEKFVYGERHQKAIDEGKPALIKTKFARIKAKRSEIPFSWKRVETELDSENSK